MLAPSSRDPRFRRPQFGLRSLLWMVTGCSAAFAVMTTVGPLWSLVAGFVFSLVLFHVAGNALGTRLRDDATRLQTESGPASSPDAIAAARQSCSPARLRGRAPLNRSIRLKCGAGALLGGGLGVPALAAWAPLTPAGAVVGSISSAVLGGLLGFLSGSFVETSWSAWRQATEDPRRPATGPDPFLDRS